MTNNILSSQCHSFVRASVSSLHYNNFRVIQSHKTQDPWGLSVHVEWEGERQYKWVLETPGNIERHVSRERLISHVRVILVFGSSCAPETESASVWCVAEDFSWGLSLRRQAIVFLFLRHDRLFQFLYDTHTHDHEPCLLHEFLYLRFVLCFVVRVVSGGKTKKSPLSIQVSRTRISFSCLFKLNLVVTSLQSVSHALSLPASARFQVEVISIPMSWSVDCFSLCIWSTLLCVVE